MIKRESFIARQAKPKATLPSPNELEKAKLSYARGQVEFTDTDRINALITLFGGNYAFPVLWEIRDIFQNGRCGLDAFIRSNPSLFRSHFDDKV